MLKSLRQLSVLVALLAGCDLVTLPGQYRIETGADLNREFATEAHLVSFRLQPASCAMATTVFGGAGGAPLPKLVAPSSGGGLMELSPTENCSVVTGGTLVQMSCTVTESQLPMNFDRNFGFRIDVSGKTALPSVPTASISASGSIEVGIPMKPPVLSITTPVTGFSMANLVPSNYALWKNSVVSSELKLNGAGLQVLFKVLISCGGGATVSTPFHWQVDTLTITPLTSWSAM